MGTGPAGREEVEGTHEGISMKYKRIMPPLILVCEGQVI